MKVIPVFATNTLNEDFELLNSAIIDSLVNSPSPESSALGMPPYIYLFGISL